LNHPPDRENCITSSKFETRFAGFRADISAHGADEDPGEDAGGCRGSHED
jgi:hypothetical protein